MEYGLIGKKLGHSFSKLIHTTLCGYDYDLVELTEEEFSLFMEKAEFKAINVTIPYKEKVIPYLYYIDEIAKKIGVVNTIVNRDGKLYGYNTDYLGLKSLIENNDISLRDKKVLILGSGGTSKTATVVANDLGAKEVLIVSRSGGNFITYDEAILKHNDADIIINTTPCGMFPQIGESAIEIDNFEKLSGVVDVVYNPLNSYLVVSAKNKGIKAVGGLYMLIAQAVFAAEKFIDCKIDSSKINELYKSILLEKSNLVLIGMPSCGKSTVGERIANCLNKEFIDCDKEIEKLTSKTIPQIFEESGEEEFRKIESQVIAEIAKKQNCVISTGGGAILNYRNIELLKENGVVLFLDRPLEQLITTSDRPLSSNKELLKKRYDERYHIYCDVCDKKIDASHTIEENITLAKEVFLNEIFSS